MRDDPIAGMEQTLRALAEQAERYRELEAQTSGFIGEAESSDGLVRLSVSSDGCLRDLTIDSRAIRLGSESLTETILDLSKRAREDLSHRFDEAKGETVGEDFSAAATERSPRSSSSPSAIPRASSRSGRSGARSPRPSGRLSRSSPTSSAA